MVVRRTSTKRNFLTKIAFRGVLKFTRLFFDDSFLKCSNDLTSEVAFNNVKPLLSAEWSDFCESLLNCQQVAQVVLMELQHQTTKIAERLQVTEESLIY